MATNTGEGHRIGSVKDRTQLQGPSGRWIKRNRDTGRLMDKKADDKPFKGVAKEGDGRRNRGD